MTLLPHHFSSFFFFNDTATTEIYTLSLHDALPISSAMRFLSTSMEPPAIIQPRVRRTQYSTRASWLKPRPPMTCMASLDTSQPARLQASLAMAVLCEIGRAHV